ncbi:FAD-binding and (Fe-S)-binding domain-containing protein [Hoyosella subflava]|nr:FAD-binding and (Fe-S)-binding domain-containing protein [Hoyosella subflava]
MTAEKITSADDSALARDLTEAMRGEVDFSARRRAEYSSDGSNYRCVPAGIVFPLDDADAEAAVAVCRRHDVPITTRGGGTSIAGNAVGDGVILELSRHMNRILSIDAEARTAVVQAGVIPDVLNAAVAEYGLRFGPDPSTHARCTIGGMIGNDACGSHSVRWGRTSDNVVDLDVLCYDGTRMRTSAPPEPIREALRGLAGRHRAELRTELGRFSRQVSGYGLHHLLNENGFDVGRALVGSEGTCVVVLTATVKLVELPKQQRLVIAGFTDSIAAADAVPTILQHNPLTCEGMDDRILDVLRSRRKNAVPDETLPRGSAWLLIDVEGDDSAASALTDAIADSAGLEGISTVNDPAIRRAVFKIREDGSGLATRALDGTMSWPGWEDAAVPPAKLGSYLRDFDALVKEYGLTGVVYGHFGEGCLHVRLDFDFASHEGIGKFEEFMERAADLVAGHGGANSGEHGDGRARSAVLSRMYSPGMLQAFAEFKRIWDPGGKLNPGIIVDPAGVADDLRHSPDNQWRSLPVSLAFHEDRGDIGKAVHRCIGVGKCRTLSGGVMCPSYRATLDEKDSTRGRARVLQEMILGETITEGWQSEEVGEALDLCLSCKGCSSDCPVGVDMASYKSEYLHQRYHGKVRPLSHYSMGWLPLTARLASKTPRLANAVMGSGLSSLIKRTGGIDPARELPAFAPGTFLRWYSVRGRKKHGKPVLLWADTFTNFFSPYVGAAAVEVLEDAGFSVHVLDKPYCCGLTWVSTGQLDDARRELRRALGAAAPLVESGIPMVVLEPSCAALFRSDGVELLPGREAETVAGGTYTLAEFLREHAPDWQIPDVVGKAALQVHCHQHAVIGGACDAAVLSETGSTTTVLDAGCCGLAGNFGFEDGHFETSRKVAETGILPALEKLPDSVVVADGFSCRTQLDQLAGIHAVHLAEYLRAGLDYEI